MYQRNRLNSELSFFQKIKEIDYILLICIILLSIISLLVMYSTDGGEVPVSYTHLTLPTILLV